MNPKLIEHRFRRCLSTYDEFAQIQKIMAQKLVALIGKKEFSSILEIGCGTGVLTKECIKAFSFDRYLANDIVAECESFVKPLSSKINFSAGDITKLEINDKFDLVISNAVFQWFKAPETIVQNLHECLKPDGILIFSTFGAKNFYELKEILGIGIDYPDYPDNKLCEELYELEFSSIVEMLKHIKNTGVNAVQNYSLTKGELKTLENTFIERYGKVKITYNPIYISYPVE